MQSTVPAIQQHAACSIGHISRNECNRERVVALGGVLVMLELAMPWPWRAVELLRGVARSMANLTMSPTVREAIATQGGWKSLLVLAQSSDAGCHFDTVRAIANLAEQSALQLPLLHAGALNIAIGFVKKGDADLKAQGARLAGNLSLCCRGGEEKSATREFSAPAVIKALGEAGIAAGTANGGRGSEALPSYAAAYAKLSLVPAIALWLFDVAGVGLLEAFAASTGAAADDVRVHLACVLAHSLKQRVNQRIVLEMLQMHDPTDEAFRVRSTTEQRMLLLKERDALATGKEVRGLMNRLLYSQSRNDAVFLHYARTLEMLATQHPSNHAYMLQKPYVQQLVELAGALQQLSTAGEAQAAALRGLRVMAEAEAVDDIASTLIGMKLLPVVMSAAYSEHEETRVEVCRLVRALARRPEVAAKMVRTSHPPPAGAPEGTSPTPFLSVMGSVLASSSARLQLEASAALEPFASLHKVAMCQAKLVGTLITLAQSTDGPVLDVAGRVLRLLA